MRTQAITKTLAAIAYIITFMAKNFTMKERVSHPNAPIDVNTRQLESQLVQLTEQIARQNNFWHRFVIGLAVGAGTAIGASVIATVVLLLLGPILRAVGIDVDVPRQA